MTIADRKKFYEGKDLWIEYVNINGYAFKPEKEGLKKLSKLLDLNIPYLKERINFYLEA